MSTVIDHSFGMDKRVGALWFWIELFAAAVATFGLSAYVFFGRLFQIGKKLNGSRIMVRKYIHNFDNIF